MDENSLVEELAQLAALQQRFGRLALGGAAAGLADVEPLLATALQLIADGVDDDDELESVFAIAVAAHLDHERKRMRLIQAALPLLTRGVSDTSIRRRLSLIRDGGRFPAESFGSPFADPD